MMSRFMLSIGLNHECWIEEAQHVFRVVGVEGQ